MKVVGYTDRWSAAAGETVRFYVSATTPRYRADLVRIIHGDENPAGPGYKEEAIKHVITGEYAGVEQRIHPGSYAIVEPFPALAAFTISARVWPSRIEAGVQGIVTRWPGDGGTGFGLFVGADGALELWLGAARIGSGRALRPREWSFVTASFDGATATVTQRPARYSPLEPSEAAREAAATGAAETDAPLLIGAGWLEADGARRYGVHVFNGKIGAPRVFDRALTADEAAKTYGALAAWELGREAASTRIVDASANGFHGVTVNRPTRAVTGHNWHGESLHFDAAPDTYDAIHFHDDDVADAGWEVSHEITVPDDLKSGLYALRLSAGDAEDTLPFVVRPPTGKPSAEIAVLLPTFSYMAYANESLAAPMYLPMAPRTDLGLHPREYAYLQANKLQSTYDHHSDGSGICFSSLLLPMLSFRPKFRKPLLGGPHQLSADLHLIDWLEAKGFAYDVVTDQDLHRDGVDLLSPYKVVLTGSHPEYPTLAMLEAFRDYLEGGGRMMYLGGNGFFWVTAVDESGTLIEVRRWGGTRSWQAEPGEWNISLTGEPGGIWRDRGLAPQGLFGIGFAAQGFDRGAGYVRTPESRESRAAFVFEGVEGDEFGDFPALVLGFGAAGYELDRAEPALGTPAHAMVLATATSFSDDYQAVIEEEVASHPWTGGLSSPKVRADVVYFEYPNGGAMFSTGSITWCSTLSHNAYDNDVSRITANVLKAFTG